MRDNENRITAMSMKASIKTTLQGAMLVLFAVLLVISPHSSAEGEESQPGESQRITLAVENLT